MTLLSDAIAKRARLSFLPAAMRTDVSASVTEATKSGAILSAFNSPLAAFRHAVHNAIAAVSGRQQELERFLAIGPYTEPGKIPRRPERPCIDDEETARTVSFIYSHVIPSFQGALAEILAMGPMARCVHALKRRGRLPAEVCLVLGDAVTIRGRDGLVRKGGDAHLLRLPAGASNEAHLFGIGEVKSYHCAQTEMLRQTTKNVRRAQRGILLHPFGAHPRAMKVILQRPIHRTTVVPSGWRLAADFHFETKRGGRRLIVPRRPAPCAESQIEHESRDQSRIVLRWSREALAEAAHELAFWYMGQIGTALYRTRRPEGVERMSPFEAGKNAVKQSLYFALRRCKRRSRAEQRAIALYNSFGFGYALGMNFRGPSGRRGMLFPADLDEIDALGQTADGGCIW